MPEEARPPGGWARRLLVLVTFAGLVALPATPAHLPATSRPEPSVGVHVHAGWLDIDDAERAEVLDRLVDAGVERVRIDVSWASLEWDGPGQIDPWWEARVARVLHDASSRGLHVLAVVWQTPPWASASGEVTAVADDPESFGRFMAWFGSRFGDDVDAYEVWNEPNEDTFFDGDAADYVALLRPAAAGIRASDPDADVVLGAPAYNDTDWLGAVYDAGAAGSFDVMATHPYLSPSDLPPEATGDDIWKMTHVGAVHELMARHGDGDLPIWFTEFGWHTRTREPGLPAWERGVTPEQQADYLVRAIALMGRDHPEVTAMYWYNARDRADSGERNNSYGLLDRDLVPKPVYWALRAHLTGATTRIAGGDRIDTAVVAASLGWPLGTDEVVVARSDLPSDAVVAAPLAATIDAPILLTPRDRLDPRTAAAISRLAPRRVTLVGGEAALSADVAAAVLALGAEVRRIAGGDRADTAATVSGFVPGTESVVVDGWASDDDAVWADALVAGGIALASGDGAVLYGRDPLPGSTVAALDRRGGDITLVGTGATSSERGLDRLALDRRISSVRGHSPSSTSTAALELVPHDDDGPMILATAATFPDGLVGTALSHRLGGRVALVDPTAAAADATEVVGPHPWVAMGGPHALPDDALP